MFYIYTSNRLENLFDSLCTIVQIQLDSPLAQEIIIVQSQGMHNWLSMQIAEYFNQANLKGEWIFDIEKLYKPL